MVDRLSASDARNIFWIGGPPDAGKSSVALALETLLAVPVTVYRQDGHERDHLARADAQRFPLHAAMRQRLAEDPDGFLEAWATTPPETLAVDARANWVERLPLIVEDLEALSPEGIVIAEGPGFFPSAIRSLLPDSHHAAWLIPDEGFKRASHARRDKTAFRHQTSEPDRALDNHIRRDLLLAGAYRADLAQGDFWLPVDGSRTVEETAILIAHWFGLPLQREGAHNVGIAQVPLTTRRREPATRRGRQAPARSPRSPPRRSNSRASRPGAGSPRQPGLLSRPRPA
jgi:hypothetical protein